MTLHGLDLQRALAAAKGIRFVQDVASTGDHRLWDQDQHRYMPNWHTDPALALELAVELPKGWEIDMTATDACVYWPGESIPIFESAHDNTVAGLRVALCEAIGNAWLEGKK